MKHNSNMVEIKRMFVHADHRGKGLATSVLTELEQWAMDLGYYYSILETGKKQPEAIKLYKKSGYKQTDKFGSYIDLQESLCFSKHLA